MPVLVIILILFILPIKPDFWCFRNAASGERPKPNVSMLTWEFMHEKLPWGLVLLLGNSYSLEKFISFLT